MSILMNLILITDQQQRIYRFMAKMAYLQGGFTPPRATPATESALRLRPRRALSSARPTAEWTTTTAPHNKFSSNGASPLTTCLTQGVHFNTGSYTP